MERRFRRFCRAEETRWNSVGGIRVIRLKKKLTQPMLKMAIMNMNADNLVDYGNFTRWPKQVPQEKAPINIHSWWSGSNPAIKH